MSSIHGERSGNNYSKMQKVTPGFCTQLRLLLWKNFTIKRRSPVVFLVEVFLPLVLILLLLLIRQSQHAYQIAESHYTSKPLPSAGIVPILQLFCDTKRDVYEQQNKKMDTFLGQLEMIIQSFDELQTVYPLTEMSNLYDKFQQNISNLKPLDELHHIQDINASSLIDDENKFTEILKTYNIDPRMASILLQSSINTSYIYQTFVPYLDMDTLTPERSRFIRDVLFIALFSNNPIRDVANLIESKDVQLRFCSTKMISEMLIPTSMEDQNLIELFEEELCKMDAESLVQLVYNVSSTVNTHLLLSQLGVQQPGLIEHSLQAIGNIKGMITNLLKMAESLPFSRRSTCPIQDRTKSKQNSTNHRDHVDKFSGLVQFWKLLEPTLCGVDTEVTSHDEHNDTEKNHEKEETKLTRQQMKYFSVVKNILYRSPKILYAPNNSVVQTVIQKANESFIFYDSITQYAKQWLNISKEIRRNLLDTALLGKPPIVLHTVLPRDMSLNSTLDGIDSIACSWLKLVADIDFNIFKGFKTETELEEYFLEHQFHDNVTVIAGLVFENIDDAMRTLPAHVRYKIRQNATLTPPTNVARNRIWSPTPGSNNLVYYEFGFVWIQDMIERTIIDLQVGRDVSEPGNYVKRIPYPCWPWDGFVWNINHIFPLCLMLSWVYTVSTLVQRIVYEKEKRLKEVMKMMGLSGKVHWCAWFITASVQMTLIVLAITLMLHYGRVLPYSDPSLVFVFLEVFAFSSISFSFLISSFYSKSRLAAACAGIFYFLTYVPYIYISIRESLIQESIPASSKFAASIFSTTAFGLGGKYFMSYEIGGVGVTWENISTSPSENDDFSLLKAMCMIIIDTVLYAVLTWYIENIHPGTYGIPKPWYFLFSRSYWLGQNSYSSTCGRLFGIKEKTNYSKLYQTDDDPLLLSTDGDERFEEETSGFPVGVEICHLRKVYSKDRPPAVDDLNLTLYENQITAFLGHNGAGKTTTMSILTGLFPPTSGTAYVYGHNICTDLDKVRQNLGMCPQHNILFDSLTVEEHLWFYGRLKGMQAEDIQHETERMIKDLGLSTKQSTLPGCLSGGMQRKLSVAIAFVGGSKTVILDEPTAGVDPFSRRSIWKLLRRYKKGRTILLSTHHMDEADELGDRIAIISNGHLKCSGSSLFLKTLLGDGQHLHILKKQPDVNVPAVEDNSKSAEILENVRRIVASAFVKFESRQEVIITVPVSMTTKHQLAEICESLYDAREQLNIKSFGVTDSGLEEIFVRIMEESKLNESTVPGFQSRERSNKANSEADDLHLEPINDTLLDTFNSGDSDTDLDTILPPHQLSAQHSSSDNIFRSFNYQNSRNPFKQFLALFVKRIRYTLRNRKGILSQIILPAVFVSISMTIALSAPTENDPPKLTMSTGQYFKLTRPRGNFVPFSVHSSNVSYNKRDDNLNRLVDGILSFPSGLGGDCTLKSDRSTINRNTGHTIQDRGQSELQLVKELYNPECQDVFTVLPENSSIPSNRYGLLNGVSYYPTCECHKYSRFICSKETLMDPPEVTVVTGDHLQNISGLDEEDFYLHTTSLYKLHRYGGFSLGKAVEYVPDSFGQSVSFKNIMRKLVVKSTARVHFNQNGYHSMPVYVNALNNAILRANLHKSKGNPASYGITLINHPMKKTSNLLDTDYINGGTDVLMAIFIIIAMSFVPASFVVFLVHERSIKAKHLQLISGVSPITYWLSNLVWDMFNYIIPATCIIGILLAFRIPAYVGKGNIEAVCALFVVYGWSITPMMYPATFLFKESSVAYISLIIVNLFTGITCVISSFMLQLFTSDKNLSSVDHILKKVFLVFPNFCLGDGLMDIALNQYENEYYFHIGRYDKIQSPMEWHITGRKLAAMAMTGFVFFIFTIFCEYGFFLKQRRHIAVSPSILDEDMDSDVLREKHKVLQGPRDDDLLRLINLTKVYKTRKRGKITAVNGLNFSVTKGECFGLLGVNGAGKTTTFKMLTGDIQPSCGDTTLLNYSVLTQKHSVQQYIGYCPQFDALFDELTPTDHLQLYARLHGIPSHDETQVVNWAIKKLGLEQYRNQTSGTLSGGNKRKLSTAISLVGNPQLLYMDEPTAGMDPHSKKYLWKTIHDLVQDGKSVVFTSHSMEECEILCSRLSIMVNGQLKCLGSIQQLKDKFGEGYTLKMTLRSRDQIRQIESELMMFGDKCRLKERRSKMLIYDLETNYSQLGAIYRCMEGLVELNLIVEYSLHQNSLDNVFINFARDQNQSSQDITDITDEVDEIETLNMDCTRVEMSLDDEPLIDFSQRDGYTHGYLDDDELLPL